MDIVTYALLKKKLTAAVAGITNIKIEGQNIIFTLSDGSTLTMTVPTPKDGKDGKDGVDGKDGKDGKDGLNGKDGEDGISVTKVEINDDSHLICTLSDGTEIDAGEIKGGVGGGLIQKPNASSFPNPGSDDTVYLAQDTQILYYWDGTSYQEIVTNETLIQAELRTAALEFNDVDDTFDLPVNDVQLNVYVNGIYLTEGFDYTIDRSVDPNTITFDTIYEEEDKCTITYLEKISEGGDIYATNDDIDSLFK